MTTATKKFLRIRAKKPVGGYILLTVQQLCLLSWLYRSRTIQLLDFRVWCAAHEMVTRLCQLAPSQVPEYTPHELHGLGGGRGGNRLRTSLRPLEHLDVCFINTSPVARPGVGLKPDLQKRACACRSGFSPTKVLARDLRNGHLGLLTWSVHTLAFATSPDDVRHIEDFASFAQTFDHVPNHPRRVPVPRQPLHLIAGGVRPAVIAMIFGTCLRCLYYHARQAFPVESSSCVKGSWIADIFQVHLRNVKAARKHLTDLGWLLAFTATQWVQNRWGTYAQVSLTWERAAHEPQKGVEGAEGVPAPVSTAIPDGVFPVALHPDMPTPQLPPPLQHPKPLQESKHQQPPLEAQNPPPSLSPNPHDTPASSGQKNPGLHHTNQKSKTTPTPPILRHLIPKDLHNTERLLALFAQAQDLQLVGTSDSARLAFVAPAEHAMVIGSAHPCGFFATLMRKQLWHFATASDEEAAHARLKYYLYGTPSAAVRGMPAVMTSPWPFSDDALTVQSLLRDLARAGFSGHIFALVHREYPEWTQEPWDLACAALVAAAMA